jgi:hypothetical protein
MDTMSVNQARPTDESLLRIGSWLMILAAVGFIGYAVLFFIRDFSTQFLELGIGHNEVNVSAGQIKDFSPSLYQYISHLQIALSDSSRPRGSRWCSSSRTASARA